MSLCLPGLLHRTAHSLWSIVVKILTVLFLAVCGLPTVAVSIANDQETDKKMLQGSWKVVAAHTGKPESDARYMQQVLRFEGNAIRIYIEDKLERMLSFKLVSDKNPKQIDLRTKDDALDRDIIMPGIFALEKNQLKLSFSRTDGKFRPESFDLPPGKTKQVSLVLERIKEK